MSQFLQVILLQLRVAVVLHTRMYYSLPPCSLSGPVWIWSVCWAIVLVVIR